jgi:hypothetical protein
MNRKSEHDIVGKHLYHVWVGKLDVQTLKKLNPFHEVGLGLR